MKQDPRTILVTDCGSTTTKALLFQKTDRGWRKTARGEAPTTVEAPVADVTVGAINAFTEVGEVSGRRILSDGNQSPFEFTAEDPKHGIDLYLSTSSAGGGLQMLVSGIVGSMSTESAERAALGAGAIVMDAISWDDGRADHERVERIRHLKPDIILMAGGVDGGSRAHAIKMAELLVAAAPKPRFGDTLSLPVIYAGNRDAGAEVTNILSGLATVKTVSNVRPELDREDLKPARDAVHEFFLSHVMSHAPGYGKLMSWTPVPVMPTPGAVGDIVQRFSQQSGRSVLCADIGGATTDVFSVFKNEEEIPTFNRTVSANYGMSYSIANVLIEAGAEAIARWLPYKLPLNELRDRIRNKMIRPTSIPQTLEDLWLEQAVCREALRLSLAHHCTLAVGLSGRQQKRGIGDIFSQGASRYELVDLMKLDVVIGSGGVLSHAPKRLAAGLMMLEGFGLKGVTELTVDSVFMMPHLGVLASVNPEAADQIFNADCLVRIGYSVVPVYDSKRHRSGKLADISIDGVQIGEVVVGEVGWIKVEQKTGVNFEVIPSGSHIDVGAGRGNKFVGKLDLLGEGILVDGRNRPIDLPKDADARVRKQEKILKSLGLDTI